MSTPTPRKWPGWDGALALVIAVAAIAVYLAKGRLGGEWQLGVVLALDAVYLGTTFWSRR